MLSYHHPELSDEPVATQLVRNAASTADESH